MTRHPDDSTPDSGLSTNKWASLTWDDLDGWAGSRSVSRGRSYQSQGRVRDLAVSREGRLVATVAGGDRYLVSVWLTDSKDKSLESKCTCPVGYDGCKHAVAVVAEYLERLGNKDDIPSANDEDPRWQRLEGDKDSDDWEEDELDEESDEIPVQLRNANRRSRTRVDWDEKIKQHIYTKGREELADLVWSLTERFPELRDEFRERIALGEGDVDRLVAQARRELQQITSEEAWRNGWTGEGNIPDYSKLLHRLEHLVELGHADAVAKLGREIIERGMEQVGRSQDEGETAMELARCLPVVFDAVAKSKWTPAQKLLFAIDAKLQDDYDLIGDASDAVLNGKYQPSDWSAVAENLSGRLSPVGKKRRAVAEEDKEDEDDGYTRDYQRDQITNWLASALDRAGRREETSAILEREARITGSYVRLVSHLIECKRFGDARRWAAEGIAKTASKLPGIAQSLAEKLCDLARSQKQWDIVAAHAAHQFFDRPSREGFDQLLSSSETAGCGESVRQIAQRFLETGLSPIRVETAKAKQGTVKRAADWPLPVPDYLIPIVQSERSPQRTPEPHFDVLIDMAISSKKLSDVLAWYDKMCAARKPSPYGDWWNRLSAHADRVAEAVAKSHPERTLEIYRLRVEQNLKQTGTGAYETVASYLRKMKPVMKSIGREQDWKQLIDDIQIRYRNRPKLMEILDRLESKPILDGRKGRR